VQSNAHSFLARVPAIQIFEEANGMPDFRGRSMRQATPPRTKCPCDSERKEAPWPHGARTLRAGFVDEVLDGSNRERTAEGNADEALLGRS